jgi:hypothetical protein
MLGAISLVIWLVVAFTLSVRWFVDEDTAPPILMAGGIAFAVAALPWLAYKPLVRRFTRRRGIPPDRPTPQSRPNE